MSYDVLCFTGVGAGYDGTYVSSGGFNNHPTFAGGDSKVIFAGNSTASTQWWVGAGVPVFDGFSTTDSAASPELATWASGNLLAGACSLSPEFKTSGSMRASAVRSFILSHGGAMGAASYSVSGLYQAASGAGITLSGSASYPDEGEPRGLGGLYGMTQL